MKEIALLAACLIFSSVRAQTPVAIAANGLGAEMVTEGPNEVLAVQCSIGSPRSSDLIVPLELHSTTTAENRYDIEDISFYDCIIPATMTTGTVDIPVLDDLVIESDDEEVVIMPVASTQISSANSFTFTITDDEIAGLSPKAVVTPRETLYWGNEGDTVTIWFDFLDPNGDAVPLEEDFDVAITNPFLAFDTAFAGSDFTAVTSPQTWAASSGGVAVTSASIDVVLGTNTDPENLKSVSFRFSDDSTVDSITVDSIVELRIEDDDRPFFALLNVQNSIPRRFRGDVFFWAFTNGVGSITSPISYEWRPFNLQASEDSVVTVNGLDALEVRLPAPRRRPRSRFNEYKFTTTQTINTIPYEQRAYTYLTPTTRSRARASAAFGRQTVTVFPDAWPCSSLDDVYTISVPVSPVRGSMRWEFIPDGGRRSRKLNLFNGASQVILSGCNVNGLYIAFPRNRKNHGWVQYIRVIRARCPRDTGGVSCGEDVVCYNGGVAHPQLPLCDCPPGFAGVNCEIALAPGWFGNNGQLNSQSFVGLRWGRCIRFSFSGFLGTTCAAGWRGQNCCSACPRGWFGANCAQRCHCRNGARCNRFSGVCPQDRCAEGFIGNNCQQQTRVI